MTPNYNETHDEWITRWLASAEAKAYISQFKRLAKGEALWHTRKVQEVKPATVAQVPKEVKTKSMPNAS